MEAQAQKSTSPHALKALRVLLARRHARIVFGAGGILATALMAFGAIATAVFPQSVLDDVALYGLGLGWAFALLGYLALRLFGHLVSSKDPEVLSYKITKAEQSSARLPLIGLALGAPLTIHAPFIFIEPANSSDFINWIMLSSV